MAKYHVNPANGEAGACRAKQGNCPFSSDDEHHESVEAARSYYEAVMSGAMPRPLSWLLSPRGATILGPEDSHQFVRSLHAEHEELEALITKEESNHLHNYSLFGFERTNQLLRTGTIDGDRFETLESAIARTEVQIKGLDSAIAKAPDKQRTVYRFVSAPEGATVQEAVEAIRQQGFVKDAAFLSTSATPDYPLYAILEHPQESLFMLEIATDKGAVMQPKPRHQPGHLQSLENEILLPRELQLEVKEVELKKRVAFGGMKEALLEHGRIQNIRDRRRMENKPYHVLPVVKLVQAG